MAVGTLTVKVVRTDTGRPIQGSEVSIGKTGNITVELPKGVDMDSKHQVTVIVTDPQKVPQKNINVIVKIWVTRPPARLIRTVRLRFPKSRERNITALMSLAIRMVRSDRNVI